MGPQTGENCLNLRQTTLYHKRTHGTVSQSKGSARGGPGSAVPRHPPIRPIFHVSLPLDLPTLVVTDSPEYSPSEPPLGSYIRMRIATLNIHTHQDTREEKRRTSHQSYLGSIGQGVCRSAGFVSNLLQLVPHWIRSISVSIKFIYGGESFHKAKLWLLFICGFITCSHSRCSSRGPLINTGNPIRGQSSNQQHRRGVQVLGYLCLLRTPRIRRGRRQVMIALFILCSPPYDQVRSRANSLKVLTDQGQIGA